MDAASNDPVEAALGFVYIIINDAGDEEWQDECPFGYKEATNNGVDDDAA